MAKVFVVVQSLANALGKCQFVVDKQVPTGSWQFKIIYVYVVLEVSEGEGNGNPLQYSCQENPVDRGAWWTAVHRITQSQTRLKRLSMHACIGEGNGNPLQCSCLENPRDSGAWWAAVYGVAQSQTRLKLLSSSSNIVRRPWANDSVYSILSFPTASTPTQDLRITKLYSSKGSFEVIPSNLFYFMMRNRDQKR